jgi:hypothetical protein
MVHNTYRRLDESSLQLGPLSLPQWALIALIGGLVVALHAITGMGLQATLCIGTVLVAGPFAAMALSEGGRPSYMRVFRDALGWALRPKVYGPGGGSPDPFMLKIERSRPVRGELPAAGGTEEWAA